MPGTRTAPATTALDVSKNIATFSVVDASGDNFAESVETPGGAILDNADIEAFAAAYQAATNASLWRVQQTIIWEGSENPTNAVAAYRGTVAEGVNLTYQDTDVFNATAHQRLVAPVTAVMIANSDTPVFPFVAPMIALNAAYITLLGAGYSFEVMQFTGRRERKNNPRIKG